MFTFARITYLTLALTAITAAGVEVKDAYSKLTLMHYRDACIARGGAVIGPLNETLRCAKLSDTVELQIERYIDLTN